MNVVTLRNLSTRRAGRAACLAGLLLTAGCAGTPNGLSPPTLGGIPPAHAGASASVAGGPETSSPAPAGSEAPSSTPVGSAEASPSTPAGSAGDLPPGPRLSALGTPSAPAPASTPDERRDELDARLQRELEAFDELLRRESSEVASARAESRGDRRALGSSAAGEGAGEAAGEGAGEDAGERATHGAGDANDGDGPPDGQGRGDREAGREASGEAGAEEEAGGQVGGGGGGPRPQESVADPANRRRWAECPDDIVAQQIREAALREKDESLKAKLWLEYESYKKATCAKGPAAEAPAPAPASPAKES